jgi:hypothetical protein
MSDESHHRRPPAERIEIPGDVLLIDQKFCDEVLGGASTKTGKRLEADGLPFVFVRGFKYRPLNEGREFLAARIQRRNQPPKRHRRRRP